MSTLYRKIKSEFVQALEVSAIVSYYAHKPSGAMDCWSRIWATCGGALRFDVEGSIHDSFYTLCQQTVDQ